MIFKILGWVLATYLAGSTIHSSKFFFNSYQIQKQRIKNKEVGEVYEHAHKQTNWSLLIFMQLAKLAIAFFLVYLLLK